MTDSTVQVVLAVSGAMVSVSTAIAGGFAMQRRKHDLQIRMLDKKHSDEMKVVDEKKKLAHAVVESHQTALTRFERDKDDLKAQVGCLFRDVEELRKIIPPVRDLLEKVHTHFENRRKELSSQTREIAPDVLRVESKKTKGDSE